MSQWLFSNDAEGTLASPIADSDTSLTLAAGQGAQFPSPGAGEVFDATLQTSSAREDVLVTARSSDTLTITRAQEGTSAQNWAAGAKVRLHLRAGFMNSVGAFIANVALVALKALTPAADTIPYFTSGSAAGLLTRDTDGTLAANSDTNIATQKATKTYVDAAIFTGGGEVNTASNVGAGSDVFQAKTGVDLAFRSIVAGAGISVTQNTDDITVAATGGAGSGRWDPMALRSGQSASALDDDWTNTGTTLDARWSPNAYWPPSYFDIDTTYPKHLYVNDPGLSQNMRAILQAIPAGDFAIQTVIAVNPNAGNLSHAEIIITNGLLTSSNVSIFTNYQDGTPRFAVQHGTAASITTSVFGPSALYFTPIVIRLERASGAYTYEYSNDGIHRERVSFTPQAGWTPSHFGLSCAPWAGELACSFSTFRYSATATTRWGAYL